MDRDAQFDALQSRLTALWPSIRTFTDDAQTVVVVPSYSIDVAVLEKVESILAAYEERFLYMLLLLRQPHCRMVLVTSVPVRPSLIDSYLALLPGADDAHARLEVVCAGDPSPRPLATKLLERGDLLARIRGLVGDTPAHLAMFNVTERERDLALALDLPIFGAAPRHQALGTKAGCRAIFGAEGVPHPRGATVGSSDEAVAALEQLRAEGVDAAVVKLNDGVSGFGNATVALHGPLDVPEHISSGLGSQGGIVEELIVHDRLRSPSAQLRITPSGDVEMLSTHDQLLGGPEGQTYIGCIFPADEAYAARIAAESAKVGRRLAAEGVRGRFALDFVTRPNGDDWDVYAIEINLRKGGTTHPFLTMHFLVDGTYDAEAGAYRAPDGTTKHYVAADSLGHKGLRGITPEEVMEAAAPEGLLYDGETRTGVVFHMLSALPAEGKFGLTAIGNDRDEADGLWQRGAVLVSSLVRE